MILRHYSKTALTRYFRFVITLVIAGLWLMLPQTAYSKQYKRIISLYPAHTENICSLGAKESLIGIGRSDDFPQEILALPRFSWREDAEKFIAARPDLVLVRPMIERAYPQFIDKLRKANIDVLSLQPGNIGEMKGYWRQLGRLVGKEKNAEKMIGDFDKELAAITAATNDYLAAAHRQKPKVYFETMHRKSRTISPQSIAAFALQQAGGSNVAEDAQRVHATNIAFYPREKLLGIGGTIDIFLAQRGRMNPIDKTVIQKEPGYQAIRAVREGKVFLIPEAVVSRPTMRIIDGVRLINAILYPELNEKK